MRYYQRVDDITLGEDDEVTVLRPYRDIAKRLNSMRECWKCLLLLSPPTSSAAGSSSLTAIHQLTSYRKSDVLVLTMISDEQTSLHEMEA